MFIVIYDDGDCLSIPQSWDKDCEGAICAGTRDDPVAIFATRKEARTAINISTKYAHLCKAQGKPVNEDFTGEYRRNLRVIPCVANNTAHLRAAKETT